MIRGKHDIKVGGGIRINQMNVRAQGFQDGFWVMVSAWSGDQFKLASSGIFGNPMADLLMGLPIERIHDQNLAGDITGRRWKIYRPFVQDDWRVTRDLTVNLGLAWAMATPISEARGRIADFIPSATSYQWLIPGNGCTAALQPCTKVGPGAGIQMDWTALEPRIGAAWKVLGSDKTVVRGGYAMYHDAAWSMGGQGLWQNPPFAAESFGAAFGGCTTATAYCATHGETPNVGTGPMIGFSDGFPLLSPPSTPVNFVGNFTTENTDIKLGRVQQFNVNVEHQLPGQIVLTAGYAGSRSSHILNYGNNINVASPSACGTPGYTIGCGPGGTRVPLTFPNFGKIFSINDLGSAQYNSLQLKAETKSSKYGVYALIGYTYSRTYDSGYSDGLSTPIGAPYFPLPNWQNLDWALSQINLNNSFTASVIYDLPFGKGKQFGHDWNEATNAILGNWQVTVIEKITSGFPIFIVDGNNQSGTGILNSGSASSTIRPDQVGNPFQPSGGTGCPSTLSVSGFYFNPCAFAPPKTFTLPDGSVIGELGNANRAPLSGPGFVNTDFSVIKRFALPWENMGLDFRTEIFNLFNHPQFDTPSAFGGGTGADIASGQFGRVPGTVNNPRLIQFGLKLTF